MMNLISRNKNVSKTPEKIGFRLIVEKYRIILLPCLKTEINLSIVGVWLSPARALPWGGRGRWFKSSHTDHLN